MRRLTALLLALFLLLQGMFLPAIYALGPDRIVEIYFVYFGLILVVVVLILSNIKFIILWFSAHPGVVLALGLALFLVSLPVAAGRYARRGW